MLLKFQIYDQKPNISLKVHVLSHASLVAYIKTVFNCYATIKHMLLLVCVDVFVHSYIYVTYTMSMTLNPFCVLDSSVVYTFSGHGVCCFVYSLCVLLSVIRVATGNSAAHTIEGL
jgi:hypothetical protein